MGSERLSVGKRFLFHGQQFEVRQCLGERVNVCCLSGPDAGIVSTFAVTELFKHVLKGELEFEGRSVLRETKRHLESWTLVPESDREIALKRLRLIEPLLDLDSSSRSRAIAALTDQDEDAPSRPTVYRWLKRYEEAGRDVLALTPRTRTLRKPLRRLRDDEEALLQAVLNDYAEVKEKRTIDFYCNELAARIDEENRMRLQSERLRLPSRATVARRLSEREDEALLNGRPGQRRSRSQARQLSKMDYPSIPLRLVEVDHTQLDVIVADPVNRLPIGRPYLTLALDTATRYVLGICLGFEPPSYRTVADCLLHAILPKDVQQRFELDNPWLSFGVPEELTLDNGKEFRGKDLTAACEALNIKATYAPARTPEAKPAVERFFGTLNTGLIHTLPGTTFSNVQARQNYKSEKEAALTLDELARLVVRFIVDVYAQKPHTGTQTSPALAWQEAVDSRLFVPRIPSMTEMDLKILLGATGRATVGPSGIRHKNIWYNSSELKALRIRAHASNSKVVFRYVPADLGTIYVQDTFEGRFIAVEAIDQAYASGLSMYNHQYIVKQMNSNSLRGDRVAMGNLRRKIDSEVAEAVTDKNRKQSARNERRRNKGNAVAPITSEPVANVTEDADRTDAIDEFDDFDEIWEGSDQSSLSEEGYRLIHQDSASDFSDLEL